MKNKKGFVFVETIVVMAVVVLSLTIVLSTYSLVSRRSKIKEYYNQSSDIYLLYTISRLGTNGVNNYSTMASGNNSFWVNKNTCADSIGSFVNNCGDIFSNHKLQNFGLIVDLENEIKNNSSNYDNGTIDFLNTLRKYKDDAKSIKMKYLVARIYRNNDYYFAALEIDDARE